MVREYILVDATKHCNRKCRNTKEGNYNVRSSTPH